jgi:hypothetical protein
MIISNFSGKANFKRVTVPVPELAQDTNDTPEILLKEMSGGEQAQFQSNMTKPEFKDNELEIVAYMLFISAIKEDGTKLFDYIMDAKVFIEEVPATVINRLNKAIWQLNNGSTEKNS